MDRRVLDRTHDLIRLAVNSGAAPEEARTAAHAACLLIWTHKLTIAFPGAGSDAAVAPQQPPRPPSPSQPPPKPRTGRTRKQGDVRRVSTATTAGMCVLCQRGYVAGSDVIWRQTESGFAHVRCNRPTF
jgi:hypothetical protein